MTNVRIIAAKDLTPDLVSQWKAIASDDRYLQSPFFQPEFTQTVAQVRDDVELALVESAGELTGLFPFQRASNGLARNVSSRLSEFHGPIVRRDYDFDTAKVMRAAGLTWWQFDHLPMVGSPIPHHVWGHNFRNTAASRVHDGQQRTVAKVIPIDRANRCHQQCIDHLRT